MVKRIFDSNAAKAALDDACGVVAEVYGMARQHPQETLNALEALPTNEKLKIPLYMTVAHACQDMQKNAGPEKKAMLEGLYERASSKVILYGGITPSPSQGSPKMAAKKKSHGHGTKGARGIFK